MMKRCLYILTIVLATGVLAAAQPWSGVLTTARATDWTQAGIAGGVPSSTWPNCITAACNTVNSGTVTPASLNAACVSAPDNTVIRIPAGTSFSLNANTFCNRSNVVFRGAGPTLTKLTLTAGHDWFLGQNGQSGLGSVYPSAIFTATNWTGGLTQGSTVLTLASTTGIAVGQNIVLDQHNAAWVHVDGVENGVGGNCYPGNTCGRAESPLGFGGNWDVRAQEEIVHVVSVDSSTQITIAAPGVPFTHSIGLVPQAFFWTCTASCVGGPNPPGNIQYLGLENMTIDSNNIDFAVSFVHCDYCWTKNVAITNLARAGIFSNWSYRNEFRDSYIASSNLPGGPTQYGIELLNDTLTKVENNIFFGITSNLLIEGSYGTVIGYNYTLNTATGNQFAAIDTHLAHNFLQLWEGNITSGFGLDNSWGSSSQMTLFRNYASGKSQNKTNFEIAVQIGAHQGYANLVANVLGTPGQHTAYACDAASPTHGDNTFLYDLGNWNGCNFPSPTDALTETSMMRWGNWDAVTYAANGNTNGIRFCTGAGAGNAACTASETASTDPTFPGLASPATTFSASFYAGVAVHAACGTGLSFWKNPSSGFCPPYPPIGPDVTCTVNCIANTAAHVTKIPAQLCYESGPKTNGFLTAFDANACYAPDISASQLIYRPTTFTDTGTNQTGGANPMVNPTFAYDGNPLTSAVGTAVHDGTGQGAWNITYFGFPVNTTPNQGGVVLNITNDWSVAPGGGLGGANLEYSLNGGSTYTTIAADVTHGPTTDSIVLANTQDFTQVRVHSFSSGCSPANCTQTGHMTEVWISTQVIPSRLQGKSVWSGKGVIK